MTGNCTHTGQINRVTPSAKGCEECLKTGDWWVHLRLCRTCGHVGCCDDSSNRHATAHHHGTAHPIIEGYDPPEGWGWRPSSNCPTRPRSGGRSSAGFEAMAGA